MNGSAPKGASKILPARTTRGQATSLPPIPRGLPGRLEWFKSLDDALAADVLSTFEEIRAGDWTLRSAHSALTDGFAHYLTGRITAAIGMAADVAVLREAGVR